MLFRSSVKSNSLWPHEHSMSDFLVLDYLPEFVQTLVHWINDAIKSSHPLSHPLLFLPSTFSASGSFPLSQFFTSGVQNIGASASASVLSMIIQDWFPLGLLVWYPWSPKDSQESSPTPQFKSISSLALSFLYSPTLTYLHDYWKSHSFD